MGRDLPMAYAFISGIPTAGKSHLAAKVAQELGIRHIMVDGWREEMKADPELKKWVDFFWDQDEEAYWRATSCDQQWENLKLQSEAFWPTVKRKIQETQNEVQGAIFEGVNLLPHLMQGLDIEGIILLGESFEQTLERNKKEPRWGMTEELQTQEVQGFWNCERGWYEAEAKKYGMKAFSDPALAEQELLSIFRMEKLL